MSKSFQDASQEYLLARQRMNEKVNKCKDIEVEMTAILHQIQEAYAARGEQAKTVGTLTVSIEGVEGGDDLVEDAVIKVFVEPESFPDFEDVTDEVEKKNQVAWTAEKDAFPATFVFDAIQQREAIVHVTVGEDSEDAEPVKEITIPIASLFRDDVNAWYSLATGEATPVEAVKDEPTEEAPVAAPTASTTETIFGIPPSAATEATTETTAEKEGETFHDAAAETPAAADVADDTTTEEPKVEDEESKTEEEPKVEEVEAGEDEPKAEEVKFEEAAVEEDEANVDAEGAIIEEEATIEKVASETEVEDKSKPEAKVETSGRVHIKASFELSEIESLAQQAVVLSKLKADMDVEIRLCDQELSSARIRYERLKSSNKPSLPSGGAGGGLLSGLKTKSALNRAPAKPQTFYERTTAALASTLTPQRRQLAWSFAFFVVVSAVFHTNGDDLLI
ncbi:Aste57867_18781 [Aphanomyces stellatus]|uniref:Aste57867_18781 protein n=1 Tax=Aphanomyces stellatus TaxID=120398 RepID=A0A485LBV5_9STRA|nr:hypothetical protein As57867_018717 [Aphanomyces stellatus]VFT95515.1 Aste57867_18781 [Aphanomyces stellatus]